ncbi:MAG TPA: hypothetical protein VGE41_09795, partial [Verrucomicrobiae bacterium]
MSNRSAAWQSLLGHWLTQSGELRKTGLAENPFLCAAAPGVKSIFVEQRIEKPLAGLKEKLLLMASHAEAAVNHAVRALMRRDDDLAR